MTSKILGIGNPFYDRFTFVEDKFLSDNLLKKGDTTILTDRKILDHFWSQAGGTHAPGIIGGSCANVIKVLAHLGNPTTLCGIIGNDEVGRSLLQRLRQVGITSLLTQGKKGTGVVNCFVSPDKQRTMQAYLGSATEIANNVVKKEVFANVKHVHLEGYLAFYNDVLEQSIAIAKAHNATTSLDLASSFAVNNHHQRFVKCAHQVDFVFGNLQEILDLTKAKTPKEALEGFEINQTAIATVGAEGCWIKERGKTVAMHYPAIKVPQNAIVDTTGAGDFFDGGFLHGIFQGKSIPECVRMANLAASYVIQQLGADLSDEKWRTLRKVF